VCCEIYTKYLEESGYEVKTINIKELRAIYIRYGIPEDMWSCHISEVERYFAVGHIPVEALEKLIIEKPDIKGIALPGMPSGSPGMPGSKEEPFVIYALKDGEAKVFMTI